MKAILILSLLLCSCVADSYVAVNGQKTLTHKRFQLGGTTSFNRGDGSSEANDYQTSFRDGAAAVGVAIGAYQAVKINSSNNALTTTEVKANTTPTVTTPVESSSGAILTPVVTFPPAQ